MPWRGTNRPAPPLPQLTSPPLGVGTVRVRSAAPSPEREGRLSPCFQHRAPRRFLVILTMALNTPRGQASHLSRFPYWHSLLRRKRGPDEAQRRCPRGRRAVVSPQEPPSSTPMVSRHSFLWGGGAPRGRLTSFFKKTVIKYTNIEKYCLHQL